MKNLRKMRIKIENSTEPMYLALLKESNPELFDKATKQIEKWSKSTAKERSKAFKEAKHKKWLEDNK